MGDKGNNHYHENPVTATNTTMLIRMVTVEVVLMMMLTFARLIMDFDRRSALISPLTHLVVSGLQRALSHGNDTHTHVVRSDSEWCLDMQRMAWVLHS